MLSDAHTHTDFCDGLNTAEEMVQAALERELCALGFSGHSYTAFDESYCMSRTATIAYRDEIARLKVKYQKQIALFCGIEQDFFSCQPTEGYDYIIGSVHYLSDAARDKYYTIDYTDRQLSACLVELCGGNQELFAEKYFEQVAQTAQCIRPDIIGHFDLLRKLNAGNRFFDENSYSYEQAAKAALRVCAAAGCLLELNTGGAYRGYRKDFYPAERELAYWRDLGGDVIITSDAHDTAALCFGFDEARRVLHAAGFNRQAVLSDRGFIYQRL